MSKNWVKKNWKTIVVVLFFAVYLCFGLLTFKDYGIGVDERIERDSTLINYKYMFPSVRGIKTDTVDFENLPELPEWKDRYYGTALQQPAVMIEHLFGFHLNYRQIFLVKHLYTFVMFFIASIFFYHLAKGLLGERKWAFLATVMLVLSPRIFGEAFYNMKDLYFVSAFIVNLYFVLGFLKKPNWKWMIGLGISTGICVNTRVVGGILIVFGLLFAFLLSIQNKTWKKVLPVIIGCGILSLATYILVTPITWTNTVQEIFNVIKTFSDYVKWPYDFLYLGESVNATNLPWHYMFVFIAVSTPLLYLFLFGLGLAAKSAERICALRNKEKPEAQFYTELACILLIIIPFVYVILTRPVLYTGWRHFYFMYPIMILFAAMGVKWIYEKIRKNKALYYAGVAVFGGYLLFMGGWILKNHPYEYAYFNVIGKATAAENFERDYWGMSSIDCADFILKSDGRPELKIWAPMTYVDLILPPEQADRITLLTKESEINQADYVLEAYRDEKESVDYARWDNYRELYRVEVDGIKLQSVFRREFTASHGSEIIVKDGKAVFGIDDITWEESVNGNKRILTGTAGTPINAVKASLKFETGKLPKGLKAEISLDGENYIALSDLADYTTTYNAVYGTFAPMEVSHIRLTMNAADTKDCRMHITLYRNMEVDADGQIIESYLQNVEAVESSTNERRLTYALDGNLITTWSSERVQEPGMDYLVTLKEAKTLQAILVQQGNKAEDYGRNLEIYVGEEKDNLTQVEILSCEDGLYTFAPITGKYVKLVLGESKETAENYWEIAEISLYE